MRILLDEEMPRGGGMPIRRNWWLLTIAVGVVFLATWLSGGSFLDKEKTPTVAQQEATTPSAARVQATPATTPANTPAVADGPEAGQAIGTPQAAASQPSSVAAGQPGSPANAQPLADQPAASDKSLAANPNKPASESTGREAPANKQRNLTSNRYQPNADEAISTHKNARTQNQSNKDKLKDRLTSGKQPPVLLSPELLSTIVQSPEDYATQHRPVLDPATTIEKDYARKKAKLPAAPEPKPADRRKSFKTQQMGTFSLGFGLPLAFPLGDQQAMGYNMWAGHNTASDYMPSAHVQYHITNKTFLQTEAQVVAPQYIRPTMLSYSSRQSGSNYVSNAIYAQKLYYFNIPVSIHHSPFPGFYMGTGLQFSSMISGVALTEERRGTTGGGTAILVSEKYSRFRNDTLSDKLNSNEFRVLLDANYYFNRFTVGLRYNQALSNYISVQPSPAAPYSFEKNRALLFYLRYNLWEEKKRGASTKSMLSLK
ncbi:hypothetical protein [Paraflavitalea sp. CAU 1676]|uniref:hypothetical protein n=1 Tax=Paraflavitalea sp. CAU 1676 TaxID=3032598 RepID=UPI0023DA7708|nr:hypothetical protein [Paraflavitalea sp. CAU 1676]MDF2186951.1 hypothetical protein [Paraflavitalea sp. CAU 1676]